MENLHIMGCWPSRIINQRRGLFPAAFDSFTLLWVNVRKRLERAEAGQQNDEEKQIDVADSALPLSFFSLPAVPASPAPPRTSWKGVTHAAMTVHLGPISCSVLPSELNQLIALAAAGGSRRAHASQSLPRKGDEDKHCASCTRLHVDACGGGGGVDFPSHMCER